MTTEILPPVLARAQFLGLKIFLNGVYNLNIIGVRSKDMIANTFNDEIHLIYREVAFGPLVDCCYKGTTDPGTYWRNHPERKDGTAIVAADMQHSRCWSIGYHHVGTPQAYEALVQIGPIGVYRDANHDDKLDPIGPVVQGMYGINLHHASALHTSTSVDKWSAGCQVIADPNDFAKLLAICKKAATMTGSKFSYTLLNEWR